MTYLSAQINVQKRLEEPSRSRSGFEEVGGGSVATYNYPYFNLRLTWGEVEAEILRRAKTRAVEGLYSWRTSRA